jgi:hypothetical protein
MSGARASAGNGENGLVSGGLGRSELDLLPSGSKLFYPVQLERVNL